MDETQPSMSKQPRRGHPFLRELAAGLLRFSGLPWLIRHVVARRRVTIILYHDPSPDVFEAHMRYLSRRYHFVGMNDVADAIERADWSRLPPRSLVVTFDDGHKGNHLLLPIFRRYGVRPTIYLVSRVIGTDRHYWFQHDGVHSWSLMPLPNAQRLRVLEERFGFTPTREYPGDRHALSVDEIREMQDVVDFEPHTCFHPVLPSCEDEESRREIVESKHDLEKLLGRPCRSFSYPNGDYGSREIAYANAAGFVCARTIDAGWNGPATDPFRLRITGVTDDASINILASQLSGITMYFRYLRRGGRGGRYPQVQVERAST